MAWKDLSEDVYVVHYTDNYDSEMNGNVKVTLQYDNASTKAVNVRFKFDREAGRTNHYYDCMYLIYNANNDPTGTRKLHKLKNWQTWDAKGNKDPKDNAVWPYYSDSFTLTKSYSAKAFYIQDIWICNSGENESRTLDECLNIFKSGGSRGTLAYRQTGGQSIAISSSTTVATDVAGGSVTITDNYNNSYTAKFTAPANATNNKFVSATCYWWSWDSPSSTFSSDTITTARGTLSKTAKFTPTDTKDTRMGKATIEVLGTLNNPNQVTTGEIPIRQYVAPKAATSITLDSSSLKNGRLTIKQNWKYTWTDGGSGNKYSPTKGYRIQLYKNGTAINIKNNDGVLSNEGTANYCDITTNYISIDPVKCGFKPTDTVQLGVKSFTKTGQYNGGTAIHRSSYATSSKTTVQHAGVMRVNIGTLTKPNFVEGQVKVWVLNDKGKYYEWKEAEVVKTYVSASVGWKESE